ncbi:MAG: hypothetical protein ACI81L_002667 [Verrucomicrobiales bacterium]|jgi:hypothetical protein
MALQSMCSVHDPPLQPVATPANWKSGERVIVSPGLDDEAATAKFGSFDAVRPYLRYVPDPS